MAIGQPVSIFFVCVRLCGYACPVVAFRRSLVAIQTSLFRMLIIGTTVNPGLFINMVRTGFYLHFFWIWQDRILFRSLRYARRAAAIGLR